MNRKYWVIGGEYEDADFRGFREGTHLVKGPFADLIKARTEWTRLTFRDGLAAATRRYHIAVEEARA